uniref:Uncharacterized protein n=1 Tax=Ascaris lumbricoides TaxID=6252 RepID=A0A0M3HHB1_ASCLU
MMAYRRCLKNFVRSMEIRAPCIFSTTQGHRISMLPM